MSTLTDIWLNAVPMIAAVRDTNGDITYARLPSLVALAYIWLSCHAVQARRVTDRDVTREPFIAVKTITSLWSHAHPVSAISAFTEVTKIPFPSRITKAKVGMNTSAVDAVGIADSCHAVNARPAPLALTALAIVFIVVCETLFEKAYTAGFNLLCRLDARIEQNVTLYLRCAVFFRKVVAQSVAAARSKRTLIW